MKVKTVWAMYFSATGTTKAVAVTMADRLAELLQAECRELDFTLPASRKQSICFCATDLVVFATPVYAGRVPNVLLPYIKTIGGGHALAIPIVLYGNRNYDDGLIELRDLLTTNQFHTVAAAAFIGEHSFSTILGAGRPDKADLVVLEKFAQQAARKIAFSEGLPTAMISVKGTSYPYRGYYQPRDRQGIPVDIRKVRPLTDQNCNDCKFCAEICPMGAISYENIHEFITICIKCGACIKKCPQGAKYYEDSGYLYHQRELEEEYIRRAEPELFL